MLNLWFFHQTISNYLVEVAIISCDFILKTDTNYQHFNYLNHVSYFGEKMSYRYCARRMECYYMLSATEPLRFTLQQ